MQDETDKHIRDIWERFFLMKVAHLHKAAQLLRTYEKKEWQQVIPDGEFPEPLRFAPNIAYVRSALNMVDFTAEKEAFKPVNMLPRDYDFFQYQRLINDRVDQVIV